MPAFDLIIFDLDGTLVPTEHLALDMTTELIKEFLDIEMSAEELLERYRGRDVPYRLADLERLYGAPLPTALLTTMAERWIQAVENDLVPTEGVIDALDALKEMPICIASNSDADSIDRALLSTGLDHYFDRRFSCSDVENPKPAPDLFLYASSEMGAKPSRCLVVEDSVLGVEAAKRAGMSVVGFAGNDLAMLPALEAQGVPVIQDFKDLPGIVGVT